MLSIFSFFFMRGRDVVETDVSTREEVDCDTWENQECEISWGKRKGRSKGTLIKAEVPTDKCK